MKIAILGTVGVPGRYGGFETLAENLVHQHARDPQGTELTVWCSAKDNAKHPDCFKSADLRYVNFRANGIQSVLYDAVSLWQAINSGHDRIILLGVSGAMVLPLVRLFNKARILTNIDGIEWKREKWSGPARAFLRASEWVAVRFSHAIIADNQAIADHVRESYNSDCHVIAYGGDHAVSQVGESVAPINLPDNYALALCRIEPENHVHTILEAWAQLDTPLVFVGNWANSQYGCELKERFVDTTNLHLLDPVYEPATLYAIRARATLYVHGHSAGGTNPSLVEMMHFGIPILAHGCIFNRHSTENKARYFETTTDLYREVSTLTSLDAAIIGANMRDIAIHLYTWKRISNAYFELLKQTEA